MATTTTTYRGYRVCSDTCPAHSVEHYSGGDTIVRDDLRTGRQLLWRAWRPDGSALHKSSAAWTSEHATVRAIDAELPPPDPKLVGQDGEGDAK